MDSLNFKSFVSFRYGELSWNSIRSAVVGIQALSSNYYYNYPDNVYQLAKVIGQGTSKYLLVNTKYALKHNLSRQIYKKNYIAY